MHPLMESTTDTIFGLATPVPPPGGSGVAVVRVSGHDAFGIAESLATRTAINPWPPSIRQFHLLTITFDGFDIDSCGLILFKGPKSYTGENVVEFHIHGGMEIIRSLDHALTALGARPAMAGEFTKRAFLNGRMDLVQAESVASIVSAQGAAAHREGLKQRAGALTERITSARTMLRDILARLEVDFDYPEEREDKFDSSDAAKMLEPVLEDLKRLLNTFKGGQLINGFRMAITGPPNAGKSSLLNRLADEDRSIVTSTPGTTRDVVSARVSFDGVPADLMDTAGIRIDDTSVDDIENEGIRRSWREIERAHIVLIVLDLSITMGNDDLILIRKIVERTHSTDCRLLIVQNKCDLLSKLDITNLSTIDELQDLSSVTVSAKFGEGIDELESRITELLGFEFDSSDILLTEQRHKALIAEAVGIIGSSIDNLNEAAPQDVVATELWGADRALGRILGEEISSADLDTIFSRFCIGK